MGLETASYVNDLVTTNPLGTDAKSVGDDHLRLIKTVLVNSILGFSYGALVTGTDTGSANTYVLTPTHALQSYGANLILLLYPITTNTGASTVNISSLGTRALVTVDGVALASGDLVAGQPYVFIDNGTHFRLVSITKRYIDALSFAAVLPLQTGNSGKIITTNGVTASWSLIGTAGQFIRVNDAGTVLAGDSMSFFKANIAQHSQLFNGGL